MEISQEALSVMKGALKRTIIDIVKEYAYSASIDGIATRVIKVSDLLELIEEESLNDSGE